MLILENRGLSEGCVQGESSEGSSMGRGRGRQGALRLPWEVELGWDTATLCCGKVHPKPQWLPGPSAPGFLLIHC